jgi:HlyD family secretion protein
VAAVVYAFLPEPVEVETAAVIRGPIVSTVDEEGRVSVRQRYRVFAPVTGTVLRIDARPGDRVARGASVAQIVPVALDARTRTQLAARVEAARDEAARAAAAVDAARAARDFARSEHTRAEALGAAGALSRHEVELAAMRRTSSDSELAAAEAAGRAAEHDLEEAKAALLSAAGAAGRAAIDVRSPVTATVLRIVEESERVVPAGAALLELGDPMRIEIVADLLSTDAVTVCEGDRVIVERWGGTEALHGRVRLVEPSSFTKISALGVEEQRVNVYVDLVTPPPAGGKLGDGFSVDVRIVVDERPAALTVPAGALFRQNDGWAAFVVEGGRARLRPVTIGLRAGFEGESIGGLAEGQEVVLHPPEKVRDGVRLRRRSLQGGGR